MFASSARVGHAASSRLLGTAASSRLLAHAASSRLYPNAASTFLLGNAAARITAPALTATAGGGAFAAPVVAAPTASFSLASNNLAQLRIGNGNISTLGSNSSDSNSSGGFALGKALVGSIAAALFSLGGSRNTAAACEGNRETKNGLELKPKVERPDTKAVKLWERREAGTLKYRWPTTREELAAFAKKHGGSVFSYREYKGVLLSVLSHEALRQNIDDLTGDQAKSALLGNGKKQYGTAAEAKERLQQYLDGADVADGHIAGDRVEFCKAKAAKAKANGVPTSKLQKAQMDKRGGSYWYCASQYMKEINAVAISPGYFIVNGGPADPEEPKGESNFEKMARVLKCPEPGSFSRASHLKYTLLDSRGSGLALHPKSKEYDGHSWRRGREGHQTSLMFKEVAEGKKPNWTYYPQLFCHTHIHPATLPFVKKYDSSPTEAWNRYHANPNAPRLTPVDPAAWAPQPEASATDARSQRAKKRGASSPGLALTDSTRPRKRTRSSL